jgi:hypothetical protein
LNFSLSSLDEIRTRIYVLCEKKEKGLATQVEEESIMSFAFFSDILFIKEFCALCRKTNVTFENLEKNPIFSRMKKIKNGDLKLFFAKNVEKRLSSFPKTLEDFAGNILKTFISNCAGVRTGMIGFKCGRHTKKLYDIFDENHSCWWQCFFGTTKSSWKSEKRIEEEEELIKELNLDSKTTREKYQ